MDHKFVQLFTDYMEKTGSVAAATQDVFSRMINHMDRDDQQKVASLSALSGQAQDLALQMSRTVMTSGQPLIEGADQLRKVASMLSDHEQSLNLLSMVLDAVKSDHVKQASLEPGYGTQSYSGASREQGLTALEEMMVDNGITV